MPTVNHESYHFPITLTDLAAVEAIVRREEIICAFGCDADTDPYQSLTWRRQKAFHETTICALLDRNVFNDVLCLARPAAEGSEAACEPRGKIGAALMAFLQSSNILIEPSMALYENPARASLEMMLFRRADNVPTAIYAEIATGRLSHLPAWALPPDSGAMPQANFHQHIRGRRNLYVAMLKVANLELSELSPVEKMAEYLRWSHSEFLFLVTVMLFACTYFTPRRVGALLKDVRSPDRSRALAGVCNAVWDMHMIVEWNRRVQRHNTENRYWILCSRDRALKAVARFVHCDGEVAGADRAALRTFFAGYWAASDASRLVELAGELLADQSNPLRCVNQIVDSSYVDHLAADLEASLLAWRS